MIWYTISVRISAQEEYGLRCLLQLAKARGQALTIPEIARAEGLSSGYVGKLLFLLRKKGLVKSLRGMRGGYLLTQDPKKIPMSLVLKTLASQLKSSVNICGQFPGKKEACIHLGSRCSLRTVWHLVYKNLWEILAKTTLADLARSKNGFMKKFPVSEGPRIKTSISGGSAQRAQVYLGGASDDITGGGAPLVKRPSRSLPACRQADSLGGEGTRSR